MTRRSCPSCRIRFTPAMDATIPACPVCGGDLEPRPDTLGYRLYAAPPEQQPLVQALVASRPVPTGRPA